MLNASLLNSACVMCFMIIPALSAMAAPNEYIVILFFVATVCGNGKAREGPSAPGIKYIGHGWGRCEYMAGPFSPWKKFSRLPVGEPLRG